MHNEYILKTAKVYSKLYLYILCFKNWYLKELIEERSSAKEEMRLRKESILYVENMLAENIYNYKGMFRHAPYTTSVTEILYLIAISCDRNSQQLNFCHSIKYNSFHRPNSIGLPADPSIQNWL